MKYKFEITLLFSWLHIENQNLKNNDFYISFSNPTSGYWTPQNQFILKYLFLISLFGKTLPVKKKTKGQSKSWQFSKKETWK
jgi:hypothetical protein